MENQIVRTVCGIMHKSEIGNIIYKQIRRTKMVVDKLTK